MSIPQKIKVLVWEKYIGRFYEGQCFCCESNIDVFNWHAGHIIAHVNGGQVTIENIRPICSGCNLSMSSMSMRDFVIKYDLPGKKNFKPKFIKIDNKLYLNTA